MQPGYDWLLEMLKEAVERGIVIVNVTQCLAGSVEMHRYETGRKLLQAGVVTVTTARPNVLLPS